MKGHSNDDRRSSCPSYILLYKSHENAGGHTATQREHQKYSQYALRVPEITADDRFVPFGIEVTGHLGTKAKKLLQRILNPNNPESDSKLRRIQGRLTILMMKWNVTKIAFGAEQAKKVPQKQYIVNSSSSNICKPFRMSSVHPLFTSHSPESVDFAFICCKTVTAELLKLHCNKLNNI